MEIASIVRDRSLSGATLAMDKSGILLASFGFWQRCDDDGNVLWVAVGREITRRRSSAACDFPSRSLRRSAKTLASGAAERSPLLAKDWRWFYKRRSDLSRRWTLSTTMNTLTRIQHASLSSLRVHQLFAESKRLGGKCSDTSAIARWFVNMSGN